MISYLMLWLPGSLDHKRYKNQFSAVNCSSSYAKYRFNQKITPLVSSKWIAMTRYTRKKYCIKSIALAWGFLLVPRISIDIRAKFAPVPTRSSSNFQLEATNMTGLTIGINFEVVCTNKLSNMFSWKYTFRVHVCVVPNLCLPRLGWPLHQRAVSCKNLDHSQLSAWIWETPTSLFCDNGVFFVKITIHWGGNTSRKS